MGLSAATTVTSQLSSQMQTYYDKLFLTVLVKKLQFAGWAYKRDIPVNEGKIIQFNRYVNFAAATTALTEGTPPTANVLSSEGVSATVAGYGDYIAKSDLVSMTAIDPNLKGAVPRLAYQAALTIDCLYRNEISGGGSTRFASTNQWLSAVLSTSVLNAAVVRDRVRQMRANDVQPISDQDYILVVHPNSAYELMSDVSAGGWLDISKYVAKDGLFTGEIGKIAGARVVESTNVKTISAGMSASVSAGHYNVLIGAQAYGGVTLARGNLQMIVKALGSAGASDPLNQVATVGWKVYHVSKVLDSTRVENIVTGRTGVESPN